MRFQNCRRQQGKRYIMGVIGSKCKVKVNDTDIGEFVKYERLSDSCDDHVRGGGNKQKRKEVKESKERNERIGTNRGSSSWEVMIPEVNHMDDCKHSKSLSLTTQVSPKSTTTTDGDDVQSVSTLTSMLENPLLKRVKPDNPLFKRADGELRPVGPVNPWKLGKDKNQIRLELEEKGLLKSTKFENYVPKVDPKEEGIIGDLRGVGIISRTTASNDAMNLTFEFMRRLPTHLTHLPTEIATTQTKIPDEKPAYKLKVNGSPAYSKSEQFTSVQLPTHKESPSDSEDEENSALLCSRSQEVPDEKKKETDVIDLKIKIIDTEIL